MSVYIEQVDVALAIDQESHEAVKLLFVLSLDKVVQWRISIRV